MLYCQELLSKAVKIRVSLKVRHYVIAVQFLCLSSAYCLAQTEKKIQQQPWDIRRESQLFELGTSFDFTRISHSQDSNLRVTRNTTNHTQTPHQLQEKTDLLQKILVRVNQIDDPYFKTLPLIDIAESYQQLDQTDRGTALLKQALFTANGIGNIQYKAWIMSRIAEVYGQLNQLDLEQFPQAPLLSVNIPPVGNSEIAGVLVTRQGLRRYIEKFEKRYDPRGKSYYWLVGEIIEDIPQPEDYHLPPHILTDVQAIRDRYITITPLQYNLTDATTARYLYSQENSLSID